MAAVADDAVVSNSSNSKESDGLHSKEPEVLHSKEPEVLHSKDEPDMTRNQTTKTRAYTFGGSKPRVGILATRDVSLHQTIGTMEIGPKLSHIENVFPAYYPFVHCLKMVIQTLYSLPRTERNYVSFSRIFLAGTPSPAKRSLTPIHEYVLEFPEVQHEMDVGLKLLYGTITRQTLLECWRLAYSRSCLYWAMDGELTWMGPGWMSCLNHSCNPNCFLAIHSPLFSLSSSAASSGEENQQFELQLIALQPIQKQQELTINYFAHLPEFRFAKMDERKRVLKLFFGFDCSCAYCVQEASLAVFPFPAIGMDKSKLSSVRFSEVLSMVDDTMKSIQNQEKEWVTEAERVLDQQSTLVQSSFAKTKNDQINVWNRSTIFDLDLKIYLMLRKFLNQLCAILKHFYQVCGAYEKDTTVVFSDDEKTRIMNMNDLLRNEIAKWSTFELKWAAEGDPQWHWRQFLQISCTNVYEHYFDKSVMKRWIMLEQGVLYNAKRAFPSAYLLLRHFMVLMFRAGNDVENAVKQLNKVKSLTEDIPIVTERTFDAVLSGGIGMYAEYAMLLRDMNFFLLAIVIMPKLRKLPVQNEIITKITSSPFLQPRFTESMSVCFKLFKGADVQETVVTDDNDDPY